MKILSDIKEEMVTDDKWSRSFFLPVCLSVAEPRLHIRSGEGRPNIGRAATSHFSFCNFSARQNNTKILLQQYFLQHGKNSGLLYMYAKMAAIRLNKDALVKMVELAVATGYFEANNWYFNERHHRQLHFCVCLFVTLGSMRLSVA